MKNAFLIIAHNDYAMLKKLIEALDYKDNEIFIHIDKKSPAVSKEMLCSQISQSTVHIYQKIDVRWGDSSQVVCEMFLIETALRHGFHDYYHIISGVDYPVKSVEKMNEFLKENNGKEFIHFDKRYADMGAKARVQYYHLFSRCYKITKNKYINKLFFLSDNLCVKFQKLFGIKKKLPFQVIQKGCNWCSITQKLAEYLIDHNHEINILVKKSMCADEVFIQTVVMNSEFKNKLYQPSFDDDYNACARYIVWDNSRTPKTMTEDDYDSLIASNALFARKFNTDISTRLIDKLSNQFKGENDEQNY